MTHLRKTAHRLENTLCRLNLQDSDRAAAPVKRLVHELNQIQYASSPSQQAPAFSVSATVSELAETLEKCRDNLVTSPAEDCVTALNPAPSTTIDHKADERVQHEVRVPEHLMIECSPQLTLLLTTMSGKREILLREFDAQWRTLIRTHRPYSESPKTPSIVHAVNRHGREMRAKSNFEYYPRVMGEHIVWMRTNMPRTESGQG
jgi:hypothetical protein